MQRIRRHLTFANVASALALFIALSGGTAIALSGSNTVFSDDLVDGQVKSPDLAKLAFTPVKPNPQQASDPCQSGGVGIFCVFVGSSGFRGWENLGQGYATAAYARDGLGIVHLQGTVLNPGPPHSPIFVLPPGYRPAAKREFAVAFGQDNTNSSTESLATVQVYPSGAVDFTEHQPGSGGAGYEGISLEGVELRAK
jgi:hypothetical protein